MNKYVITLAICAAAMCASNAQATTIKLTFDYMATNLKGEFASASGGKAIPIADLFITDHADLGVVNPVGGMGGVRATFKLRENGLSQFSNGVGSVFISAFELNFPNTSSCVDTPACANTDDDNGYDSTALGGLGNNWRDVSGVGLSGGVEWAENGANNGWGSRADDPAFGQEFNWGNGGAMNQSSGLSTIDIFSADGRDDISVTNLLGNPVLNVDPALPEAFAWIKVRSNASANLDARGIGTGDWWGTPQTSGQGANQRWQLNVLATNVQQVSEPPVNALLLLVFGAVGLRVAKSRWHTEARQQPE